nr:reverse transcriptase domain-containing protein [Tanacetum cinerariifolium]
MTKPYSSHHFIANCFIIGNIKGEWRNYISFREAWERFKEILKACPHHGFTKLTQIDNFYNGLNENDQDSLNVATGGNLLSKTNREALNIIENKLKVHYSRNKPNESRMNTTSRENSSKTDDRIDKLTDQISTLVDIVSKKVVTPAMVKAVEKFCVACGGSFFQNQTLSSGTLLSNTIPNSKGEMKAITTRSGVAYEEPLIPTNPSPKKTLPKPNIPYPLRLNDQKLCEKATNQMEKFFQIFQDLHFDISFADALLLMSKFASTIKSLLANKDKLFEFAKIPLNKNFSVMLLKKLPEKLRDPNKFLIPCSLILGKSFLRIDRNLIDVYEEGITLQVNDEAITFNLNQTTRYSSTYDDMSVNRIDVIDVASEEYAQEVLGFSKNYSGGNPTSTSEPIISNSSPSLTLFKGSDFILEKIEAYLKDDSQKEVTKANSSIEEPPKLELKDLPYHLEYAYLEGVDKLPVIIERRLKDDEKEALLKVLKSHKRAIAWKITDIKGIDPRFCTHKILIEEDYKPVVQSQRRVNPKIHEVIKKEVIKLLDARMIYPISDSSWVSLVYFVPKKGGITVGDHRKLQLNELNELRDQAYNNSLIYKEKTKKLHDSKIKNCIFNVGDRVLLFNSHLKIFSRNLKTRWSGPFTITQIFPYGTIELSQPDSPNINVNGHRVKHYFGGDIPLKVVLDLQTFPIDK